MRQLLFLFAGNPKVDSESKRDGICIAPEKGSGQYNRQCFLTEETEITKEILVEAVKLMQLEIPNCKKIFLSKELAENIDLLPETISSLIYHYNTMTRGLNEQQSKEACIKFLKKLPPHVTEIKIHTNLRIWKNPNEIVAAVPKHVTSITLHGEILKNCTEDGLRKFFSSFHDQIKQIHILGDIVPNVSLDDKTLHNLIIQLPFSVETLSVPRNVSVFGDQKTERQIKVPQYREEHYFPTSYSELTSSSTEDLFQKAKNLLSDYTKNTSCSPGLTLFVTFHWNRNHLSKVNNILNQSNSIDELLSSLSQIEKEVNFNSTGSLARRIHYIKHMQYS